MHDVDRALHLWCDVVDEVERLFCAQPRGRGVDECLGIGLGRPQQGVLDLFGGMRLGEHLGEIELPEIRQVAVQPIVPRVFLPALWVVESALPAGKFEIRAGDPQPARRGDGNDTQRPLGVCRRQVDRPGGAAGEADQHRSLCLGGVENGEGIGREFSIGEGGGAARSAGSARATAVEGDDPIVPGQERHLCLPEPRRHDGPRRQQHHRRGGVTVDVVAVDVVVQRDAVATRCTRAVRKAGGPLFGLHASIVAHLAVFRAGPRTHC